MSQAATTLALFERAHEAILLACAAESVAGRLHAAELAAQRGAAAVIAARADGRWRSAGPIALWEATAAAAPELGEWTQYFAAVTRRRQLVESGRVRMTVREADDLVRDAEAFLDRVAGVLGLPWTHDGAPRLAPVRSA